MIMTYEDEEGKVGELSKIFSLKPTKEFLDWTDNSGTVNENQSLYKYQQLSLNFEEVNLNQKLNFMKIMGTPVRVVIKKGSEVWKGRLKRMEKSVFFILIDGLLIRYWNWESSDMIEL